MRTVLYIYVGGACLVALRLGWPMIFRFDTYDWKYSWTLRRFCWQVLLWPLLTPIFPKALLDPYDFLTDSEAAYRRELDKFRAKPPPCGPTIRFVPKQTLTGRGSDEIDPRTYGEFILNSSDVEHCYQQRRKDNPTFFWHEPEDTFMLWLSQRDPGLDKPSDLPPLLTDNDFCLYNLGLDNLKLVVTDLAIAGQAKVFCSKCATDLLPGQVTRREECVNDGNFGCDRLYCPKNHLLVSRSWYCAPIRRRACL